MHGKGGGRGCKCMAQYLQVGDRADHANAAAAAAATVAAQTRRVRPLQVDLFLQRHHYLLQATNQTHTHRQTQKWTRASDRQVNIR